VTYILIGFVLWLFFQALSIVNGWGGVLGYVIEPLALAALLAGLIAAIANYASVGEDRDALRRGS
jgi:hypothetical protein